VQKFVLAFMVSLLANIAHAQTAGEITLVKTFGGTRFEMDTLTLSPRQVMEILKDTPLAYEEFKQAKKNYSAAGVMGFTGGLLIGFPIGTLIAGGDPEWGLAIGGAALLLGSIPLNKAFQRHATNALDLHNKKFSSRIKTNFYLTGTGFRLSFRF
jgi:hypothetical protein